MNAGLHRAPRTDDHTWVKLMRDEAWGRQKGRCLYCHTPLTRSEATADHVVPRSEGVIAAAENIAAACCRCNQAKRSMSAAMFKKALKRPPPLTVMWIEDRPIITRQSFDIAVQSACRRINVAGDRAAKRVAGCLS